MEYLWLVGAGFIAFIVLRMNEIASRAARTEALLLQIQQEIARCGRVHDAALEELRRLR